MAGVRSKWDKWVAPILTFIGLPGDISTALSVIGTAVGAVLTFPAVIGGIWAQLPLVTKIGWIFFAVVAGPMIVYRVGLRIKRELPWTDSPPEFPDLRPSKDLLAFDYWPDSGDTRYVILRKVRVANNSDEDLNLNVRLRLKRPGGNPTFTLGPATRPPGYYDEATARDFLSEVISIEAGGVANGYMAFWIPKMLRQFMRVNDPDSDPKLFECVLLVEDVHTGLEEPFPARHVIMNKDDGDDESDE